VSNDAPSPYDWQFKLGDLGLSYFNSKVVSSGEPTASDAHGTRTYGSATSTVYHGVLPRTDIFAGAPECYRADDWGEQSDIKVKQNVDIWSLGCVYSEAVRWVAGGYNGLREYRAERKAETDLIRHFRDGDCFHNGEKALKAVHKSHKKTRDSLCWQDHITGPVIDIMIKEMLDVSAGRPTAMQVWLKSQRILDEAQEILDGGGDISPRIRELSYPPRQPDPPLPPHLPPGMSRDSRQRTLNNRAGEGRMNDTGITDHKQMLGGEQSHSPESTSENGNEISSSPSSQRGSAKYHTWRMQPNARPPQVHQHVSDDQVLYGGTRGSFSDDDQINQILSDVQSNRDDSTGRPRANSKSVSFDTYPKRNSAPDLQSGTTGTEIARSTTGSLTGRYLDVDRGNDRATTLDPASYENDTAPNRHKSNASFSTSRSMLPENGQSDWNRSQPAPAVTPMSQPSSPQQEARHGREASYGSSPGISQHQSTSPQATSKPEQATEGKLDELPFLSIEAALAWKKQMKSGMNTPIQDEGLLDRLKRRDHVSLRSSFFCPR
jgi:hypothetical protein